MSNLFDCVKKEENGGSLVDMDGLLNHIYFKNTEKNRICIKTSCITSIKELYKFCLDLFCKGLVLCHGGESMNVEINSLSMENIQEVIDKLAYTGINTKVQLLLKDQDMLEVEDFTEESEETKKQSEARKLIIDSIKRIDTYPENNDLPSYKFNIKVGEVLYSISFDIQNRYNIC